MVNRWDSKGDLVYTALRGVPRMCLLAYLATFGRMDSQRNIIGLEGKFVSEKKNSLECPRFSFWIKTQGD